MTFLELAETVLKEEKTPLSVPEIWARACEKGYDKQLGSDGKTPVATLGSQLYVSSRDNARTPFSYVGERPKRFFLKSRENQLDLNKVAVNDEQPAEIKGKSGYSEKDLHPLLTYFARNYLHCHTKTINHLTSSKKDFGEWVHPDLVGCYFPFEDWKKEVYEFSASINNFSNLKFFSFEMKLALNFGNLRANFFQTVSNSSWANEAYLVAAEVLEDPDFRNELGRLSNSFGIGIIRLNVNSPDDSEIIYPARYREVLDWEMINKLAMNADFRDFLSTVKIDIGGKIHKHEYDPVLDAESLVKRYS